MTGLPPGGHRGLSPPTRGSPRAADEAGRLLRSIPAHAGEPAPEDVVERARRVYPRPRGGAARFWTRWLTPLGLSPPTRGSLMGTLDDHALNRSIPAHAGEP